MELSQTSNCKQICCLLCDKCFKAMTLKYFSPHFVTLITFQFSVSFGAATIIPPDVKPRHDGLKASERPGVPVYALHVGNLDTSMEQLELKIWQLFGPMGAVHSVRVWIFSNKIFCFKVRKCTLGDDGSSDEGVQRIRLCQYAHLWRSCQGDHDFERARDGKPQHSGMS